MGTNPGSASYSKRQARRAQTSLAGGAGGGEPTGANQDEPINVRQRTVNDRVALERAEQINRSTGPSADIPMLRMLNTMTVPELRRGLRTAQFNEQNLAREIPLAQGLLSGGEQISPTRRGLLERAVRDGQTKLDGLRNMGVSRWQRTLDSRI